MESVQGQVLSEAGARLGVRSRRGAITLALLCAVQFLDIADSAIVNVALPSIQHSLGFSQQDLQWVASGYILTYGGFLLLGGRLGDLLGRRRVLLAGLSVFAVSSLTAGLAASAGLLVAARLVQGTGAALMAPAALSELTVSFRQGKDRKHGARGMGSRQRDRRRRWRLPRRSYLAGTRMAVDLLRQPAGLCHGGCRSVPPARGRPRRQDRGSGLRLPGGGAGDRGHAAAGLWPCAGTGGRLGIHPDHRHLDRVRRPAPRVRAQ